MPNRDRERETEAVAGRVDRAGPVRSFPDCGRFSPAGVPKRLACCFWMFPTISDTDGLLPSRVEDLFKELFFVLEDEEVEEDEGGVAEADGLYRGFHIFS